MKTIIDTATASGQFTTLLSALKTASMTDMLRAPGPYTLFAPTDEAFKKLAPGALNSMIKDLRRLKLLLTHHIVAGTHSAESLLPGDLKVIEGVPLVVTLDGANVTVSGAKVVQADIKASNGVIHALDTVITAKNTSLASVA